MSHVVVNRPRAQGYGVKIADDWFRVIPSVQIPLTVSTQDSLAPRQESSANPDENLLDLGNAVSRSNLTGGEGLDRFPRGPGEVRRDTDPIRFWDSADLDIHRPDAGQPYGISLVENTAVFDTPASAPVDIGASNASWYYIAGSSVHRFNGWSSTTPDESDNLGVTLTQLAVTPDDSVAVLDTNGEVWWKGANTSTYLQVYDTATDGDPAVAIWLVKGRIIAATRDATSASGGTLIEISPVILGTPAVPTEGATVITTIDTYPRHCHAVVDAGHAIIGAFSDGSVRSYVPQSDTAGTAPVLTVRARVQVPAGEEPFALGWNLGTLLILTLDTNSDHVRLYSGQVLDDRFDYVVGALQLVRTWTDADETAPDYKKAMVNTRDEIQFWIAEATATQNLWHYDLTTGGLVRHRQDARSGVVGSVAYADRLAFIDSLDIVTTVPGTVKPSGYLISPVFSLGLNTTINWTSFVLEASGFADGRTVTFYRSTDPEAILDPNHGSWTVIQTLAHSSHSGVEQTKINISSNTLAVMVRLTANSVGTLGPTVQRFALRGIPAHRDWVVEVPINVSDLVEVPARIPIRVPGLGNETLDTLLAMSGISTTLVLLDPPVAFNGVLHRLAQPTNIITDRGSVATVVLVQFRGTKLGTAEGASFGTAGLGIGLLGVARLGVDT